MLERLKRSMLERIERGAVKSEINGDTVYLKKSKLPLIGGEWQQINPPVNEDGSWNIVNLIFGGKRNFIILLIILAIAFMVLMQFKVNFDYLNILKDNPCVQACIQHEVN